MTMQTCRDRPHLGEIRNQSILGWLSPRQPLEGNDESLLPIGMRDHDDVASIGSGSNWRSSDHLVLTKRFDPQQFTLDRCLCVVPGSVDAQDEAYVTIIQPEGGILRDVEQGELSIGSSMLNSSGSGEHFKPLGIELVTHS